MKRNLLRHVGHSPPAVPDLPLALQMLPLQEPLRLHQDAHVFDPAAVGEVEPFGQVSLQVRLDPLIWLLTLKDRRKGFILDLKRPVIHLNPAS